MEFVLSDDSETNQMENGINSHRFSRVLRVRCDFEQEFG